MNTAFRGSLLALLLLASPAVRAAPPESKATEAVSKAQRGLQAARENLSRAVSRIQKDPPSNEDLEAAHQAVEALRSAIEAGAGHEDKDLEYAKTALAARKDLRVQGEYVEERRAKVHLHEARRSIDAALAKVNDAVRRSESKEASPREFEEARAALASVKKAMEPYRSLTRQDAKFEAYVREVDGRLARDEDALDARWTQREVDGHRRLLDERRRAMADAMTALEKGGADTEFERADRAASALTEHLEKGKVFESRDKAYRADAERARGEVTQSRRRMEGLLGEVALKRLKSELEPAHRDLQASLKAVRARKPSEDALAEARTASIVVRKLVEKYQPQAAASVAFGKYVNEVKKTLVDVEVELQKRGLESARADAQQALRAVERRNVTDEQFEELKTALTVLEKTLEGSHTRHPELSKAAAEAKTLLRDARTTTTKRRFEVDVQRQRAKVAEQRKKTEAAVREIARAGIGDEQIASAEAEMKQLETALQEGSGFLKKDRDYASYDRDTKDRIKELNDRIAKRKLALSASRARAQLTERTTALRSRMEVAKSPESKDEDLEEAGKSLEALTHALEANAALEPQDAGYAAHAERGRGEVMRQMEALEFARQARGIRRVSGEAFAEGVAAAKAGVDAKNLREKSEQLQRASATFKSCETDWTAMARQNPALAKVVVLVEGQRSSPKEVGTLCAERAQAIEPMLRETLALIEFEDGPKRAFELAKGLLAKAKKDEALPHVEKCISSGGYAAWKYPELKEREFEVAGSRMTLTSLISECVNRRKTLVTN